MGYLERVLALTVVLRRIVVLVLLRCVIGNGKVVDLMGGYVL